MALCVSGEHEFRYRLFSTILAGETRERILDQYPSLKSEHIPAAISYAADLARERIVPIPV
jgi:uncharacterized protein (DUF433 family)